MSEYQFHIDDRSEIHAFNADNFVAAKCEAMKIAGRTICEEAESFWDKASWGMTVKNGHGLTLFRLEVSATEAPAMRVGSPTEGRRRA
jgi:hypothetical protein